MYIASGHAPFRLCGPWLPDGDLPLSAANPLPLAAFRGVRPVSVAAAAVLSVLVAWLARWGPDWPAQEFRAWAAGHDGLSLWTMRWYGGSALPGYSVLYPIFAGALGAGTVGVLSCVGATWAACGLAPRTGRARAVLFGVAVAISVTQNLLIGQVPFLLGSAFALGALRATIGGRRVVLAGALAALASLSSPLAGGFVLLVAPAVAVARGWRRAVPLTAGICGPIVAMVVGGANGPFPCPWQTFAGTAGFCAAVIVFVPGRNKAMRVFALCYLLAAVAAFMTPNPIGGNIARLGKLVAVPLACYFLSTHGSWVRVRSAFIAATAVFWPAVAFASSMATGASDPSRNESFYRGVESYLQRHGATTGRVEVPFTREHWESYFLARNFAIARGWERQSDLLYNRVLYHALSPSRYRAWLDDNAVNLVALPRTSIDRGGLAEVKLLRHAPSYLRLVWHDANWQVWRVVHPAPLVTGPARLTDQDPASLTLRFASAGTAVVRVRASNLWRTGTAGTCTGATSHDWLLVRSRHPATVEVTARLSANLVTGADLCS